MTILSRARRLPALAAVVALSGIGGGAVALADNVKNDVLVGGNDTITAGGSTTVNYQIQATGGSCDAADGSAANVSIQAPSGVTATPTSLSFTSCGVNKPVTFSSSSVGSHEITVSVSDTAGTYNPTPAKFSLVVTAAPVPTDSTAPVIDETIAGTLGSNGWYTSDVKLTWSVTDAESAFSSTGCGETNITADQQSTEYTCSATSTGGTSSKKVSIKRDSTAPTNVAFNSDVAADGGRYFPNNVPTGTGCTASDATSGVAGCVVTGRSTAVGTHTLTATATDNAGNQATATRTYSVRVLALSGFFQPVDMSGVLNTVKSGATVPLKFTVADEGVAQTSTSVVKSFIQREVPCGTLGSETDDVEITSTGGTSLRYDATAGQFIQNWQTPAKKIGACYVAIVTMIDGSPISANFKLK